MSTKIQINSLEALERLIGGDTEVELEIRRSVVEEFARRHLKAIANEEEIQRRLDRVEEFLRAEIFQQVNAAFGKLTSSSWDQKAITGVKLHDRVRDAIASTAHAAVNERIREQVEVSFDEERLASVVKQVADYRIKEEVKRQVDAEIAKIRGSL